MAESIMKEIIELIFGEHDKPPAPVAPVNAEEVISKLAAQQGQGDGWRTSIVDLLTVLGLDSSLAGRQKLANELGYQGDINDDVGMNEWLHGQVMAEIADHTGKI